MSYVKIARLYSKNESAIRKAMKNKEKIHDSFHAALQTANFTASARDEALMKVEKSLKFLRGRYE